MEKLEKLPPEVLIYVQNVRKHFTGNEVAREYFGINDDEDKFFNNVIEVSQKNFKESGEPELSIKQFEELRPKSTEKPELHACFFSMGELGLVSLN
jgi:hypothetical protein